MRQKFVIQTDGDQQRLIIQEYAELDKDILSFICEERHEISKIEAAADLGQEALIAALRTDNMYPPRPYAVEIADAVVFQLTGKEPSPRELVFDDNNFISKEGQAPVEEEDLDEDGGELDELLDDDLDDEYDDKKLVKDFKSSIKIADDDSLDVDDEN
jgi:hypothetical protein